MACRGSPGEWYVCVCVCVCVSLFFSMYVTIAAYDNNELEQEYADGMQGVAWGMVCMYVCVCVCVCVCIVVSLYVCNYCSLR